MSAGTERCGPLCQHPGCWHSTCALQGSDNNFYLKYLSKLTTRKSKKARDRSLSAGHSSLTSDGLPTLKIQTLEQDNITDDLIANNSPFRQHNRAHTLPSMRASTGRNGRSNLYSDPLSTTVENKSVNFVQMHLEEEPGALDDLTDAVFAPVLFWRPGKSSYYHHDTHASHTCTMVHVPLHTQHSSVHSSKPASRLASRQATIPGETRRAKSPLHLKRMDLTNALPPEKSSNSESPVQQLQDNNYQRLTTAEVKDFSYLGDVPHQILAEILHQLRSESTSDIGKLVSVPQSTAVNDTKDNLSPPPTHVPSTLTYDLSTKRVFQPKLPPNAKNKTSFSRELAKRPLQILRKQPSEMACLQPISEGEGLEETIHKSKSKSVHLSTIQPEPPLPPIRTTTKSMEALLQRQCSSVAMEPMEQLTEEKQVSPRRVNLELANLPPSNDSSPRRIKSRPPFNSPRSFSEESSFSPVRLPRALREQRRGESTRVQSSTSPDFMLVGAHFTDGGLVLMDRGHRIVHQLTDTDDSDANLLFTDVSGDEIRDLPPESSSSSTVLEKPSISTAVDDTRLSLITEEANTQTMIPGVRPPPPSAVDNTRPSLITKEADPQTTIPGVRPPPPTAVDDTRPSLTISIEETDTQTITPCSGIRPPPPTAMDNKKPCLSTTAEEPDTENTKSSAENSPAPLNTINDTQPPLARTIADGNT